MLSDEKLVQHQAERVDVGPLRERRARRSLLGRHVARRPCERVRDRQRPRDSDAEIGDPDQPVVVDQHVGRLEIAMKDALGVRRGQPGAQLMGDVDDLLRGQPADAAEKRGQVLASNELHRKEDPALGLADVEDATDCGCVIWRASRTSLSMRSRASGPVEAISFNATASSERGHRRARHRPCRPGRSA